MEEGSKLKNLVDSYMKKEGSFSLKEQNYKNKENNEVNNKNKEEKRKEDDEKEKLKDRMREEGREVEEVEDSELESEEYDESEPEHLEVEELDNGYKKKEKKNKGRSNEKDKDKHTHKEELESYDDRNTVVVFIGNVPLTIQNKSDLVKKLQVDPKIVQSVHFRSLPVHPKYATNKKIGIIKKKFSDAKDSQNAYVKLTDSKYLEQLLEKNTMEVDGHHLFINANNSDSFSKFSRKKTVFVGRLPPSTNEDELYNIFMNISPVKGVRIVRDPKTMKSKGFGFVAFDNRLAVSQAIKEFNNTEFKGYTLNVSKCLDEKSLKETKQHFRKRKVKEVNKNKTNFKKKKFH